MTQSFWKAVGWILLILFLLGSGLWPIALIIAIIAASMQGHGPKPLRQPRNAEERDWVTPVVAAGAGWYIANQIFDDHDRDGQDNGDRGTHEGHDDYDDEVDW